MTTGHVTERDIIEAARELLKDGVSVNHKTVRAKIGRGSMGTINKYMPSVWAALGEEIRSYDSRDKIPDAVFKAATAIWTDAQRMNMVKVDKLARQVKEDMHAVEQQRASMDETLAMERGRYKDAQAELEKSQVLIDSHQATIEKLNAKLDEADTRISAGNALIDELKDQVRNEEKLSAGLRQDADRYQQTIDDRNQTIKRLEKQHEKDSAAHQKKSDEQDATIRLLKQDKKGLEKNVTDLHRQIDRQELAAERQVLELEKVQHHIEGYEQQIATLKQQMADQKTLASAQLKAKTDENKELKALLKSANDAIKQLTKKNKGK